MRLVRMLAAAAISASLASTSVLAASPVTMPATAPTDMVRAGANMQDQSELHGGFIIPLLVIAAVVAAIIIIADHNDNNAPASP